jgi:Ca2+-binding RTX toxin-like protein
MFRSNIIMATVTYSFENFVSEFVVNNTTANDQAAPDVAVLANGDLFFSFESDRAGDPLFQDVMFRRFDANGNALDTEDIVVSAGGGADDEDDSAVAVLSNGNVVVVNEDNDGDTEDDVEFHVFDPSGAGVNTQNIVTQAEGQATDNQTDPAVAMLSGGGFVVVYTDEFAGSGTNTNAEFVIYNNDGSFRAGATVAGGNTTGLAVSQPAVIGLTGGNFVVTWTEDVGGGNTNIKFRVYNSAGGSVSTEFTANTDTDDQNNPVLAALPNGGFALAYVDQFAGSTSDTEIEVKFFDSSGNQVGNTGIIDFGSDLVSSPDIAVISGKYLLVSYTSDRNGDNDVLAQVFDFSGNKIGEEFNLEVTSSDQTASSLAGLGGGRFFAAWQDDDTVGDLSGYHVSAQGTEFVRTTIGDGTNETLTGDDLRDIMNGGGGNDTLNGGAGSDTMSGGNGNDIYIVAAAGDSTIENAGQGTDTVRSYINWTLSSNVERLELQGAGHLNGTGNSLNNTLVGNSGNNSLSGGNGNDYITAGGGNDTLNGGGNNDRLIGGAGSDILNGGTGNDVFQFNLVSDSPAGPALRDSIVGGFSHGFDRIDLATIDANALVAGNQAFSFIGAAAFSGVAGQLRYSNYSGTVIIDADVNGDSTADMQILVAGTNFMTGTDFIL